MKLRPLTIAMQQSLAAILAKGGPAADEIIETFGQVVLDETQRAAAKTVFSAIDPLPARRRLGVSADETRADKREFLIYDLFGPVTSDIKLGGLIDDGHVLDVEVRIVPTQFEPSPLVERGDFDGLLKEMTDDPRRNRLIERLIIGEARERGEQVLVLTHRREHASAIDAMATRLGVRSVALLGGAEDEDAFNDGRRGLLDGSIRVAAGTLQAVGQGIDVPKLAVGIIATPLASDTSRQQFGQARGRFCRPGKATARLYYLWDRLHYSLRPVENLARWNRTCVVLDGGKWIEAKEFIKRVKGTRPVFVPKGEQ